jgi:hypothetical protein
METNPPPGMWAATGAVTSKAPTLTDIRRGSFSTSGWHEENQKYDRIQRRASQSEEGGKWSLRRTTSNQSTTPDSPSRPKGLNRTGSSGRLGADPFPAVTEEETHTAPTREIAAPIVEEKVTPQYTSKEKEIGGVPDSKESSEVAEKEDHAAHQAHLERQVSPPSFSRMDHLLTLRIVLERLRTASQSPMDALNGNRPESVLEVVPDYSWLPHHHLRSQCRGLGRHAFPPAL